MRGHLCLIVIAFSVIGCTTTNNKPINEKSLADLKNQSIVQTARKVPDFAAMTAGKAAFGLLGALAMISEGNSIVADNKVADPADSIATELSAALSNAYSVRVVTPPVTVSSNEVRDISQASVGAARFVIDVQTINWSFGYFATDWTHYRVIYTAKARLIDAQSKSVIAEGFCKRIPESNSNAPTYEIGRASCRERV